ncbi:hypothetical protein EPA93_05570 [Ktedonosporobacter rubrisoli]|uniref:DUF6298 domain-containing protein n=1 Tax=Ktedonosporobacter rubrisoli TaxID=2509675 RepID=A0A4P6JKJ3_KTERU|nr:hypothetical protein [Ktedonosporobacter rubrisoli]QBD75500.1 hypothetical protein EPA93_05570 [Ktedonosporobacter rubrisoli]
MSESASTPQASRHAEYAPGPLVVCAANPRYFSVATDSPIDQKPVYLTGSHIWNNLQDGLGPGLNCSDVPEQNDYSAYLAFLKQHGHNFIRLWRWEQFRSQAVPANFHLCMMPQPWPRTGPGLAPDGKPKFDLSSFDSLYFDRLRARVIAAGKEGIYVSVMLFDGFGLHLSKAPDHIEGHPFYAANNINGIALSSINDSQVLPLDPGIKEVQEAYIRKVIDTVADLSNVLYEVANESAGGGQVDQEFADMLELSAVPFWGDTTAWQYEVIEFVKQYEQQMGYDRHPIGMTMQFPVADQAKVNEALWKSPADWISPGNDDEFGTNRWFANPPENPGTKVVLTDTDHYAAGQGDALWAWKSFLRGHNPILMDYGIINVTTPLDPSLGVPSYESLEPARYAMGDTLRFANRIGLREMVPRSDLSSTGYVLANPGKEYLVLQPDEAAHQFEVTLEAGNYTVEWFHIAARQTEMAGELSVERRETINFAQKKLPSGPVVLYLKWQAR